MNTESFKIWLLIYPQIYWLHILQAKLYCYDITHKKYNSLMSTQDVMRVVVITTNLQKRESWKYGRTAIAEFSLRELKKREGGLEMNKLGA